MQSRFRVTERRKNMEVIKVTNDEVRKYLEQTNGNKKACVQILMAEYGMSQSNAYRRINLIEKHMGESYKLTDGENLLSLDVSNFVPSLSEYNGFMERAWFNQLFAAHLTRTNCLLIGDCGCGKTEAIRFLSATEKMPFLRVSFDASLGMADLVGQVNLTDGNTHFTTSVLLNLIQYPSIILFDEVSTASPGQIYKLHELLDSRSIYVPQADRGKGRIIKAHEECRFFLAANPTGTKYIGTQKFNVALPNRTIVILVPPFTVEELRSILSLTSEIKEPLLELYGELRKLASEQKLQFEISLRNLNNFCKLISLGLALRDALDMSILNHIYLSSGEAVRQAVLALAKSKFGRSLSDDRGP